MTQTRKIRTTLAALAAVTLIILTAAPGLAATITVNTTLDGAVSNDGACTLREAITNANGDTQSGSTDCAAGAGDDTINFDASLSGQTIPLGSPLPDLASNIAIDGSALAAHVNISGNNLVPVLYIEAGMTVSVTHVDIINGNDRAGAGIENWGVLSVSHCTFSGNTDPTRSGRGGGIYNRTTGALTVNNSTFSGNSAGAGRGGGINNRRALTVSNSILSDSTTGGDCVNSGGTIASAVSNLIKDPATACGLTDGVDGNIIGVGPYAGCPGRQRRPHPDHGLAGRQPGH